MTLIVTPYGNILERMYFLSYKTCTLKTEVVNLSFQYHLSRINKAGVKKKSRGLTFIYIAGFSNWALLATIKKVKPGSQGPFP